MENSFKSLINQSKSILILLPTKPYFDQVAAALGLFLSLREHKDIAVYSPSSMTVEFNRLIGVNKISSELGNKNLVIRFTDYKASDIERVSYDIENSQFRLTVIPKQKIAPPTKDQIELSYSGVSSDTVIIVGGANESHFPALSSKDLSGTNIVHIGTKDITLSSNKSYISFSRPASSVSEVMASLIEEGGLNMDEDIATNLLMGIEEGSNDLQDPSVNAETFAVMSGLMRKGGKRESAQGAVQEKDFPVGSIPGSLSTSQVNQPRTQIVPQPGPQEDNNQQNKSEEGTPQEWLQPKIYKGSSIS
jgi:hypothetical protein